MADCIARGDEAFLHKEFEKALSFYSHAVDENNSNADAYRKRGNCHFEMHNYADAVIDATSVMERKPGETGGYILKGKCLTQLKRFEEAFVVYKHGLDVHPGDAALTKELSALQSEVISRESSVSSYDAVKLCSQEPYPGDDELKRLEQEIMTKWNLFDLPVFTQRVPNTELSNVEITKAMTAKSAQNFDEVLNCLTLALEYRMGDNSLLKERAEVLQRLGNLREAFRTCNAIATQQRLHKDWMLGGNILSELGLPVTAESWIRRATKMSPSADTEAAILFQNIRVRRLYSPLTQNKPVDVQFTQYGRAVFCKEFITKKQMIFSDCPLVLAQTLASQYIPACSFCATSLLSPADVFESSVLENNQELKKAISLFWPSRDVFSCRKCKTQTYCSEECADKAWLSYHRVICPAVNARMKRLHEVCVEYNEFKPSDSRIWKGWWNASFSPLLLARMWATIACEGKRLGKIAGREKANAADLTMAQAPYRRFIAYGQSSNAEVIPNMFSLMVDVFKDLGDGMKYNITKREFDGRYFQSACNVQAFSDSNSPLKQFVDSIKQKPRWRKLMTYLPGNLPEAEFAGLFPLHACLNHSCANNAEVWDCDNKGNPGVCIKARQSIKPGEEIFINYVDTKIPRRERRACLYRAYNFWCQCPRCQFEGDGPEVCTHCGKKYDEQDGKLFPRCSKCKAAWYCSQACQKIAWKKGHKKICCL